MRRKQLQMRGVKRLRTPENAALICERLCEGYTLRQIAAEIGVTSGAICIWAVEDDSFAKHYTRAMETRADLMAEEILAVADDGSNDWTEREGHTVINGEHIQRSRLRVDTRKWLMARMLPKKYGDRLTHAGDADNPMQIRPVLNVFCYEDAEDKNAP
jgi:hypothetical protein